MLGFCLNSTLPFDERITDPKVPHLTHELDCISAEGVKLMLVFFVARELQPDGSHLTCESKSLHQTAPKILLNDSLK